MNTGKRPSSNPSVFLVGKNSRGNWVVQDQSGRCGGLFVGQADALKFALAENGNRREAVITVPGVLELDMNAKPATRRRKAAVRAALQRVA